MPLNVAVYVRVSTQEQKRHGISVGAQEDTCRAWVDAQGHHLAGVYNDAGLSARAKYKKRPAMLALLDDARAGRLDLIVFTKLDRWFRNVADYYEVQTILEAHNVKWRALQEDYETETASGRLKVNIMLAVAQDEADRTSERIKAAAAFKRRQGEVTGRPPLGYVIEGKHFAIDPAAKPALDAFFGTYLETLSTRCAIRAASARGLTLNPTHAARILRNPTYRGDAHGVPCPAYLTGAQARVIDGNTGRRARVNRTGRVYLFSGLLRCGHCGGAMSSAAQPSGDGCLQYYRCQNHIRQPSLCPAGGYVNEPRLERQLLAALAPLLSDRRVNATVRVRDRTDENRRLLGKLDRLREMYVEGELSREAYDAQSAAVRAALTRSPPPEPPALSPNWEQVYTQLSPAAKKVFWKTILRRAVVVKDAPPRIELAEL